MQDSKNKELKSAVEDIKETGESAKALTKLMKEKVEVEFYVNQDKLDILEVDEARVNDGVKSLKESNDEEAKKKLEILSKVLEEIKAEKESLIVEKLKGYLVQLKYRDVRLVQTAVTEALTSTNGMNFDINTQILMILQERKLMTVYLSLRKHENLNERYFASLDEIVKVSDTTIDKLYDTYSQEFEFTELERKNS